MKDRRRIAYLLIAILAILLLAATAVIQGCKTEAKKKAGGEEKTASSPGSVGKIKPGQQGFKENQIGEAKEAEGISVTPVYFQSVDMVPTGLMPGSNESDIHLEADVKAIKGNKTGFGIEEFIPYITAKYEVKDSNGATVSEGAMMPMNASDGPHYGINIKMPDAGKFDLKFVFESPEKQGYVLHSDKVTGVEGRFWKKPIEMEWDFNYIPVK